jgi:TonB family protein
MSRLEKKCFFASAGTHAMLLVALFVGPALMMSRNKDLNLPVLTFLPGMAVDEMVVSGGSPTATAPPAPAPTVKEVAPPAPPQVPVVETPPPPATRKIIEHEPPPKVEEKKAPHKSKPEPEAEVVKKSDSSKNNLNTKPKNQKKTETAKPEESQDASSASEKPARKKIQPSFVEAKEDKEGAAERANAKARADAAAAHEQAQRAFADQVQKSLARLGSGLSSGTSIDVPGPGGAAYANYGLIIKGIYAGRWTPPAELNSDSLVVKARVVVKKDGTVIEARIATRSGNRTMDSSVDRALNIRSLPPFPEGAKDAERVFNIDFDLKTKRQSG